MVKVDDPRDDRSGIRLRTIRADEVGKQIKKKVNKTIKKSYSFNENNLGLQKIDIDFYNEFISCTDDIKKEFIFLWEEISDLTGKLDYITNKYNECNTNTDKQTFHEVQYTYPDDKRKYIFSP